MYNTPQRLIRVVRQEDNIAIDDGITLVIPFDYEDRHIHAE